MTTTPADDHLRRTDEPGLAADRREHLRTVAPVLVAVLLLFGLTVAGFAALGELLDFGIWLVGTD
jgi:hypothetical protein